LKFEMECSAENMKKRWVGQGETIWKLPRAFIWVLPLAALWIFALIYVVMHIFLGVPLIGIVSPFLSFGALTLAMTVGVLWAARYSARIGSSMPVLYVVAGYGLVCFPLWAHFGLSLRIGDPRFVVGGAWIAEGLWGLGAVLAILLLRVKTRP